MWKSFLNSRSFKEPEETNEIASEVKKLTASVPNKFVISQVASAAVQSVSTVRIDTPMFVSETLVRKVPVQNVSIVHTFTPSSITETTVAS